MSQFVEEFTDNNSLREYSKYMKQGIKASILLYSYQSVNLTNLM